GDDTLYAANTDGTGDTADNRNELDGGAGDDTFHGAAGSDLLIGGTGADTYHLSLGSNSSGKFVVDTVVDADAATLSGISLTNLKPISAGSNIYKADSNPDVRVILNGSTVTIVQAATKEVIRLEGYVEGSNDFGLTFGEEAEIPDAPASSGAFDTTTESFSYNPEDYVIHEG